jgi:hypothetical protein
MRERLFNGRQVYQVVVQGKCGSTALTHILLLSVDEHVPIQIALPLQVRYKNCQTATLVGLQLAGKMN